MRQILCAAAALVVALFCAPSWAQDSPVLYAAGKKPAVHQTVPAIKSAKTATTRTFQMSEETPVDESCRTKAPGGFNSLHEYTCAYQLFRAFSMPLADPAKRAEFDNLWSPDKWKDSAELKMDGVSDEDRIANTFALIRRMRDFTHERFDYVKDPVQKADVEKYIQRPVLDGGIGTQIILQDSWQIREAVDSELKKIHGEAGIPYADYQKALEAAMVISPSHQLVIDATVQDSPAEGTLKAGDIITAVVNETGEHVLNGMTMSDAVKEIRGGMGSSVTLKVLRKNSAGRLIPLSFTLQRVQVQQRAVTVHDVDGIRHIRVENFVNDLVMLDFFNAVTEAEKLGMKGITVDLRGNPGGRMDYVVGMLEMVSPRGLILTVRQRTPGTDKVTQTEYSVADGYGLTVEKALGEPDANKKLDAEPRVSFNESYARAAMRNPQFVYEHPILPAISEDMPIVVLVDVDSYSASEIFAGAIQAMRRGIVIGQPSAGKGAIMTSLPLPEGGGADVTNGQFYPGGADTKHKGVIPERIVDASQDFGRTDAQRDAATAWIKETYDRLQEVKKLQTERTRINDQRFEDEMAKRDANDLKPPKDQDPRYQQ